VVVDNHLVFLPRERDLYKSTTKNLKVASSPPRVQRTPIAAPQTSSSQFTHISEYSTNGSGTSSRSHPPPPPVTNASSFLSVEEEKAILRYEEAKRAVDRHQAVVHASPPRGYDASWEPSPPEQPYSIPPPTQAYTSPQGVANGLQLARQTSILLAAPKVTRFTMKDTTYEAYKDPMLGDTTSKTWILGSVGELITGHRKVY